MLKLSGIGKYRSGNKYNIEMLFSSFKIDGPYLSGSDICFPHTYTYIQCNVCMYVVFSECITERDELYLRNADLSSKLEKTKIELKSVQTDYEQEKTTHQSTIQSNGQY